MKLLLTLAAGLVVTVGAPPALLQATSNQSESTQAEVASLVARMQAAVLARDAGAYLSLVDRSEPVFFLEHSRWAEDWVKRPVNDLRLEVSGVQAEGDTATADLNATWSSSPGTTRSASLPVTFRRSGQGWLYAGEKWVSASAPGLTVRVQPGLEGTTAEFLRLLPEVRAGVGRALGFTPSGPIELKVYRDANALGFMTLLSLPTISGWNEPGEALKMVARPGSLPSRSTLAHEMTHSFLFQRFPGDHFPWWAHEGLAQFAASAFWNETQARDYLQRVVSLAERNELVDWERVADFDTAPTSLWAAVYPQGYAFFRFLEEQFGANARMRWTEAAGKGDGLDAASRAAAAVSFPALDARFREWLSGKGS